MKISRKRLATISLTALTWISASTFAAGLLHTDGLVPTGKGWGVPSANAPAVKIKTSNGIDYHGGPLMGVSPSTMPIVYTIWYGKWDNINTEFPLVTNFIKKMPLSSYYNINSTYYDANNNHIKLGMANGGGTLDNYSLGSSLTYDNANQILINALNDGSLPVSDQAIYILLTSKDVTLTGFCSQYCGWHAPVVYQGQYMKLIFVGDATTQCPSGCQAQHTSPNNDVGIDGMMSIIAHELSETVTDPLGNAWYDSNGDENADKCAWSWGPTKNAPNGSMYNITLAGVNYLIQQIWVNANGGYCAMSY